MTKTESIYLIAIICLLTEIGHARIDTLYTCRPGDPIQLEVDTQYVGYTWSPAGTLDNHTIYNPIARPLQTTLYVVEAISVIGDNLIQNGDFSAGNTGFTSQYDYSPGANPTQATYGVFLSAKELSPQFFMNCLDHTDGMGNLMVVDGSPEPDRKVWCQTILVQPDTEYAFSAWVTTILSANPARLQFSINSRPLGAPFSPTLTTCLWWQFYETWFSDAATEAEICIINQNTNASGNDFALDDFSFFELGQTQRDSFLVIVENIPSTTIDTAICSGTILNYAGEVIPAASSRTFQFMSVNGCDSIVNVNVGVLDTLFEYFSVDTLCPGEFFDFLGHTISQDTFLCETTSQGGTCDTLVCLTAVFLTDAAIDISADAPACFDETSGTIFVEVEAGLPPYQYRWEDGSDQAFRQGIGDGSYKLTVTDAKSCTAEVSVMLEEPAPLSLMSAGSSQFCNGRVEGVIELNASGGTKPYSYTVAGGSFQASSRIVGLDPGEYNVWVKDENGCTDSVLVNMPAPFMPTLIIIGQEGKVALGEEFRLEGLSDAFGPLTYQWQPESGLSCPTCAVTDIQAITTTQYTLTVTDPLGCILSANYFLRVDKDANIFVPNVFSPNGDGINDTFSIFAGDGVEMIQEFNIYDRWGNQLFYRAACLPNDPSCAWDGNLLAELLKEGIYVYSFKALLINGEVEQRGGDVLLMR